MAQLKVLTLDNLDVIKNYIDVNDAKSIYCIMKLPKVADQNGESCISKLEKIAEAFG